jgi:hypothetical protein
MVMVSSINFGYKEGELIIKDVIVANPWNGDTFTGWQSYKVADIARWDIYKITYQQRR